MKNIQNKMKYIDKNLNYKNKNIKKKLKKKKINHGLKKYLKNNFVPKTYILRTITLHFKIRKPLIYLGLHGYII